MFHEHDGMRFFSLLVEQVTTSCIFQKFYTDGNLIPEKFAAAADALIRLSKSLKTISSRKAMNSLLHFPPSHPGQSFT